MKDKLNKVKRIRVDWHALLFDIGDLCMSQEFWSIKSFLHRTHRKMSDNRICYNILKKYYSTTALDFVRHNGGDLAALNRYKNILDEVNMFLPECLSVLDL